MQFDVEAAETFQDSGYFVVGSLHMALKIESSELGR